MWQLIYLRRSFWAAGLVAGALGLGHAQGLGGYEISGQDARLAGQTISLWQPGHPLARLDSTLADASGRFVLRGVVPAPDVYLVRVGRLKYLFQVPLANQEKLSAQVSKPLAVGGAPLSLAFSGSVEATLWQQMQQYQYFELKFKEVAPGSRALRELMGLLRAHASSYLAPYLAFNYLRLQPGTRPLLDSLTTRFAQEQPTSLYLPRLRQLLALGSGLEVGAPAPDLTLPGPDGQPVALSSLRGQYVLVDFWASWCAPCRADNPTLRAAYKQFRAKKPGFAIYAVSMDTDRAKWQQALQEDSLPWSQVSDLQGQEGPSGRQYGIWALPSSWLLDPEGRIVAKNLRGDALARELRRRLR